MMNDTENIKSSVIDELIISYPDLLDIDNAPIYTVLVVDDNLYIRELVESILSMLFNVICANDGIQALKIAREESPELIVSDIMMPELDGMQLCSIIKNDIDLSHIPVILLTALADEINNMAGLMQGADDYVTKPFNPRLLLVRCANLLRNRIILQRRFASEVDIPSSILSNNPIDKEFLLKVDDILEKNIEEENFDIVSLCQEMGMSRTNVYNKFRALVGNSPNDYILQFKIKKASSLLINKPQLSVFEVSLQVGFKTANYFSKTFKKITGTTPLQYRKDHTLR